MNQPDLGLKVTELRQQKGLTQEQLAERCEVSPRTIQRIENGEVDPRVYTIHCLGEVLEFDFGEENTSNENLWLAGLHISSIFVILIIPLLLWSWKKNQSYKIDQQGRQVLNFQITMTLMLFAAAFLLIAVRPDPGTRHIRIDVPGERTVCHSAYGVHAIAAHASSDSSASTRASSTRYARSPINPYTIRSASRL